jgi:phosphorylcholine metabolism protein LicD
MYITPPTSERDDVYYDKPLNQIVRNKKLKFNKNSAKNLLIDVNNILRTNGIDCFIVFGTLLGAYRDQDIIEHDKDVDMAIVGESEGECFKDIVLQGEFLKHGILLAKNPRKYTLIRGDHYIDIYHYVETSDGDFRSRITPHANYKLKKEDFPLQEIDFLDQKFLTVNNIERYLEERYGDNWRVPIKNTKAQF